jgi:hypothetical protein
VSVVCILIVYGVTLFLVLPSCAWEGSCGTVGGLFKPASDYSMLAGIFIATLAVERLVDPLSRFLGDNTPKKKDDRDTAMAEARANAAKLGTGPRRCGSSGCRCGVGFGRFLV